MSLVCTERANERTSEGEFDEAYRHTDDDDYDGSDFNQQLAEYPLLEEVSLYAGPECFVCGRMKAHTPVLFVISSCPPSHNSVNKCESYRVGFRDILISNKEKL